VGGINPYPCLIDFAALVLAALRRTCTREKKMSSVFTSDENNASVGPDASSKLQNCEEKSVINDKPECVELLNFEHAANADDLEKATGGTLAFGKVFPLSLYSYALVI